MVLWELAAVVVDPEHVQDLAAGPRGDVRLEDHHVRLPQRVHQICSRTSTSMKTHVLNQYLGAVFFQIT